MLRSKSLQRNGALLEELAIVCERYEVLDRTGPAADSATLKVLESLQKRKKDIRWIEASCGER